jgi:hypothetical protein
MFAGCLPSQYTRQINARAEAMPQIRVLDHNVTIELTLYDRNRSKYRDRGRIHTDVVAY